MLKCYERKHQGTERAHKGNRKEQVHFLLCTHPHTHTQLNVLSFSTKFSYLKNKHFGDVIHFSDSTVMRGLGFSC